MRAPWLVAAILAATTLTCRRGPEDAYLQQPQRVAEGVWVLLQPRFQVQPAGNLTVIEHADGLVVVDVGGSPGAARRAIAAIRDLSAKPVKAIVITHWHGDHALGLSEFVQAWPTARTISSQATQAHLRTPATMNTPSTPDPARNAELQRRFQGFDEYCRKMAADAGSDVLRDGWADASRLFARYRPDMDGALTVTVGEGVADRTTIDDPERPLEILLPGRANTDGDAVVWLPRQRLLITGDIVVAPVPFGFGSYPSDWIATLESLRKLDFAVLVPGHGSPQRDTRYLDQVIDLLQEVRIQVGAARELPLEEVRKRIDLAAHRVRFTGEDPWLELWFDNYWTQPIVASAYKEARGEPIVQSLN